MASEAAGALRQVTAHPVASGHAEHDQESAPLSHVLKERFIDLVSMRTELRLIVGLAVAQLLVAAIMLGLKNAGGGAFAPSVYAFPADSGDGVELVSQAAFVIGILITTAAWAYILAGAFRSGVGVRSLTLVIFLGAFWAERDALDGLDTRYQLITYALLTVIVLLGVVTWFPERALHRDSAARPRTGWRLARRAMVPLLFLLVGGIYLTVFLGSRAVDAAGGPLPVDQTQVSVFSNDVFDQLDNIQYLLIPILVLAGSDFGEWGQLVVARTTRRLRTATSAWIFGALAALAGAGIAVDGLITAAGPDGGGAVEELSLAAIVALVAVGLYFLAKPRGGWAAGVPFAGVAVVAILDCASGFITQALQGDSDHLDDYISLASAALWVAGGIIAVALLASRRGKLSPGVCATLVFIVLVGITDLLGSIWVLGNFDNAPFGITADNAPYLGVEGIKALAGILVVAVVVGAAVRRRLAQWSRPLTLMVVVAVTLELLSYIDLLYANKGRLEDIGATGSFALGGAIILVLALFWDLAVSGEAVTNVEGRFFPRDTRVLMFVGYVLLVSAAVLMFASLHDQSGNLLESSFDPEQWVEQGILFLGVPLVITVCIAGFHRWRGADTSALVAHRA